MSFAQQTRDAITKYIGDREFTLEDVALHLDLISGPEKKKLRSTLRDFSRRGEIQIVRPGVFVYVKSVEIRPAEKKRKMWSLLRSRRVVTTDELVALAGVTRGYAMEFLQVLVRQGVVKRIGKVTRPGKYQMIKDLVKMPPNEEKAERMRALRVAKKKATVAIDQAAESMIGATKALAELKTALDEIPEDDDADI